MRNYIKIIRNFLSQGYSVYFDATNPSISKREELINLAQEYKISARIFWFSRNGRRDNNLRISPVPEIAYRVYSKNFETPSENEGCKVIRIN